MSTPSLRPRAARTDGAVPSGPSFVAAVSPGRRLGTPPGTLGAVVSGSRADQARRPAPWAETQGRGAVQNSRREGGELSTPPSRPQPKIKALVPQKGGWYLSNTNDLHPYSRISRPTRNPEGENPQLPSSPVRAHTPQRALARHAVRSDSASHRGSLPRTGAHGRPSERSSGMAPSAAPIRQREIPSHRQPCRDTPPRSVRSRLGPLSESSQENRS
jgi:hypothetical protein